MSWVMPRIENSASEVPMKATQTKKPVGTAESKNESTDREPAAVLHDKGGERPKRARRSFTIIDDDWSRLERQRGRLKDALLTDQEMLEAMERIHLKKSETVAESKYEPTDYERAVLAKQAERLKDQVRVPRIKFVVGRGGGWREFDHPDQATAFALLKEAFGTADDQSALGLLDDLCEVLPIDENSPFEFPRADDLNRAVSVIAAGKPVDEFHAAIFADVAVCRITRKRLLQNLKQPIRFDLSPEMKFSLEFHNHNPKDQIDREVKIDNRPVLEFSLRYAIKLQEKEIDLIAAAGRYRAAFESSRTIQLSAVTPVQASVGEIKYITANATPKKSKVARAGRLKNGSAVTKLPQKTDSTTVRKANGHTPT
jgi:hypothetical protein